MAIVVMAGVLPGWKGTEGQAPGSHQLGTMSLFDEGFPLPPEPFLTQNPSELGKELPPSPCRQPQGAHAWLIMRFELLHGGLEQRWERRKHRPGRQGDG